MIPALKLLEVLVHQYSKATRNGIFKRLFNVWVRRPTGSDANPPFTGAQNDLGVR